MRSFCSIFDAERNGVRHDDIQIGHLNVSRETFDRLKVFEAAVLKWNPKINLVSKASLSDIWTRHIVDSVQVATSATSTGSWLDLGSGGGFPGLVIAAVMAEKSSGTNITLVESDKRKSAFLRSAAREMSLSPAAPAPTSAPRAARLRAAIRSANLPEIKLRISRHSMKITKPTRTIIGELIIS